MKKYSIHIALSCIAILTGCSRNMDLQTELKEENITLNPSQRFIQFDTEISTRGALITGDYLKDKFAVLGYQYPGVWEAEKVFATPNVFYEDKDKTQIATPQIVEYDNAGEIFNYSPLQVWSGNRYSFFAYYPADKGTDKIQLVANQGDPYIIYTPDLGSDPTTLFDLMTASYIDTGVASSASVGLEFKHRLAAIDIGARNYYEYDHNQIPGDANKKVTIEIVSLEIGLDNITSTSAKIYLDHTIPTELNPASTKKSIQVIMVGSNAWAPNSFDVEPNTASDRGIRIIKKPDGEVMSTLLLLPQKELVHGRVKLTYRKKFLDDDGTIKYQRWTYHNAEGEKEGYYTYDWLPLPSTEQAQVNYNFTPELPIDFTKELIEGRRYFIELTFTSDAVSVNIIAADEWDDKDDIKHEFE